jgi:hypothetical protein
VVSVETLDWGRILAGAEGERLAPMLYSIARERSAPAPVLARLRSAWLAFGRQHLLGVEQLGRLLDAFAGASIPAIPLKGPALGETLYREPALRPFTDLDVLVRRQDVRPAVTLLSALGYRALEHERPLAYELAYATAATFVPAAPAPGALPIDLHWGLVSFPAGATPTALDADEVWTRAVALARWGRSVLTLSPEDLLLSLALHLAVHHPLDGLAWQLDLALLLRRLGGELDWEAVVERARRWRVGGAVYFALRRVERSFASEAPVAVLARIAPSGLRGALLARLVALSSAPGRFDHVIPLRLLDRRADLARALAAGLIPSAAWVRQRYATESAARGYLSHYRRIARLNLKPQAR